MRTWEDLEEKVGESIKRAQAIFGRGWYVVDNIMIDLSFPTIVLIEKACLPGLVIKQVEQRKDEEEEKIKGLDCIGIHDLERLIKQPFVMEGKIHIFIRLWHKLAKNELEDHRCNAQLGIGSAIIPILRSCYEFGRFGEIS